MNVTYLIYFFFLLDKSTQRLRALFTHLILLIIIYSLMKVGNKLLEYPLLNLVNARMACRLAVP